MPPDCDEGDKTIRVRVHPGAGRRSINCTRSRSFAPPTGRSPWTRRGLTFHNCEAGRNGGPSDAALWAHWAIAFSKVRSTGAHLQGGPAGPDTERGQGAHGSGRLFRVAAQDTEPGVTTRALGRDSQRVWRRLRESPDYVADWRASAGRTVREAPPYAFRRQTEADLKAARWNLLAWEDPRHAQWAELFWADAAMIDARVAKAGEHAWRRLVRGAGATFTGLRLLEGAVVLKVWRGRETGQIRVIDGAAFDPAHSGLEVAMRQGVDARGGWVRVEGLGPVVFGR